jgi:hypothetical protein
VCDAFESSAVWFSQGCWNYGDGEPIVISDDISREPFSPKNEVCCNVFSVMPSERPYTSLMDEQEEEELMETVTCVVPDDEANQSDDEILLIDVEEKDEALEKEK